MNASSTIETFTAHRQFLFSIAYRMLGSLTEADDMVQEVWLRWQTQDAAGIQSPRAWLRSAMKRLCIDQLRSARHQREEQYGVSLPEASMPAGAPPEISAERENSLTMALALIQGTLKPVERAVFLLREVFDYDYADTAVMVGKAEANCRQIVCRAKAQLQANTTPPSQPNELAGQLVEQFVSAAATGEVKPLLALMTEESLLPPSEGNQANCRMSRRSHVSCSFFRAVAPARRTGCAFESVTLQDPVSSVLVSAKSK